MKNQNLMKYPPIIYGYPNIVQPKWAVTLMLSIEAFIEKDGDPEKLPGVLGVAVLLHKSSKSKFIHALIPKFLFTRVSFNLDVNLNKDGRRKQIRHTHEFHESAYNRRIHQNNSSDVSIIDHILGYLNKCFPGIRHFPCSAITSEQVDLGENIYDFMVKNLGLHNCFKYKFDFVVDWYESTTSMDSDSDFDSIEEDFIDYFSDIPIKTTVSLEIEAAYH